MHSKKGGNMMNQNPAIIAVRQCPLKNLHTPRDELTINNNFK